MNVKKVDLQKLINKQEVVLQKLEDNLGDFNTLIDSEMKEGIKCKIFPSSEGLHIELKHKEFNLMGDFLTMNYPTASSGVSLLK